MAVDKADADTPPCLLPLLQPVRHCLHPFLSNVAAARLLQTSTIALSLLTGYSSVDPVFAFHSHTVADVKACIDLYDSYHLRIFRMSLARAWNEPLVDSATGQSLLPPSLVCLSFGSPAEEADFSRSAAYAPLDGFVDSDCAQFVSPSRFDERLPYDRGGGDDWEFYRFIRLVESNQMRDTAWTVWQFAACSSEFNQPIPPGALPPGLRFLQFNDQFN